MRTLHLAPCTFNRTSHLHRACGPADVRLAAQAEAMTILTLSAVTFPGAGILTGYVPPLVAKQNYDRILAAAQAGSARAPLSPRHRPRSQHIDPAVCVAGVSAGRGRAP